MFKLTVLLLCIFNGSCGRSEARETINPMDVLKQKKTLYFSLVTNPYNYMQDCDSLTFIGLWEASGAPWVDLFAHERSTGKWFRHPEVCYPHPSRSSISFEGILGALHALWNRRDFNAIRRMQDFGNSRYWLMGEGPLEYTFMPHIAPLIAKMLGKKMEPLGSDPWLAIKGYKLNVVANYIYLKAKVYGGINKLEIAFLREAISQKPQNPIFHALLHRYTDGNQEIAIKILMNEQNFPFDRLPDRSLDLFHWSDAPAVVLYTYVVSILEST